MWNGWVHLLAQTAAEPRKRNYCLGLVPLKIAVGRVEAETNTRNKSRSLFSIVVGRQRVVSKLLLSPCCAASDTRRSCSTCPGTAYTTVRPVPLCLAPSANIWLWHQKREVRQEVQPFTFYFLALTHNLFHDHVWNGMGMGTQRHFTGQFKKGKTRAYKTTP